MKTKEEICAHLSKVGYAPEAIMWISGFLVGKGYKNFPASIYFLSGNKTEEYFLRWFLSENKKKNENLNRKEEDIAYCGDLEKHMRTLLEAANMVEDPLLALKIVCVVDYLDKNAGK